MPSIPANLDWLFLAIGALLAIGSLSLLFWSLFRDRDRKRAKYRCPKCWYDLSAADGTPPPLPITCPECGRSTTNPRHLRKRRRRYRYAFLALILLLASPVIAYYPRAKRNGWVTVAPTWFLIDTMPIFGYPSPLTDELAVRCGMLPGHASGRRVPTPAALGPLLESTSGQWGRPANATGTISSASYVYLAHRITHGNLFARPISPRWQASFGAFHEEFGGCLFNLGFAGEDPSTSFGIKDPAVATAVREMYKLPIDVRFRTRPVWPEGVPFYVEVNSKNWWPFPSAQTMRVRNKNAPDRWYEVYLPERFVLDETLPLGSGSLELDVRVMCRSQSESNASEYEQDQIDASLPYRIEGTIDQVITPVSDPAIDALVGAITVQVGGGSWSFDDRSTRSAQTQGIAFGVLIEYCLDGEPQYVERRWWSGGTWAYSTSNRGFDWEDADDSRLKPRAQRRSYSRAKPGEHWTVRIRSDPETALRVIDATKYWQGDVTIPLTIR